METTGNPIRPAPTDITSARPDTWPRIFAQQLDLERAFRELDGFGHFHTETLRGCVRLAQCRTDEAEDHFQRAFQLAESYDLSDPSLALRFLRLVHLQGENLLLRYLEGKIGLEVYFRYWDKYFNFPGMVFQRDLGHRELIRGYIEILKGDYSAARSAYGVASTMLDETASCLPGLYLNRAVCARELDRPGEHLVHIERYLDSLVSVERSNFSTLCHLMGGIACSRYWGEEAQCARLEAHLESLDCHPDAKAAFLKKAGMWYDHSVKEGRTIVIY